MENKKTLLLTVKDLQRLLNVGRDTAYALMRAQSFPSMKLGGRYYVSEEALRNWMKTYEYKAFVF